MLRVFVSATSRDLRSYRQVVAEWAKSHGYEAIVQDDFEVQPDHVTVVKMLSEKIAPCDAVIHLAGYYYGFEPTNRPPTETRRSYTQLEYELGKEFDYPVYRFIARNDYKPDQPYTQGAEEAKLQQKHRRRLTQGSEHYSPSARTSGNELYYEFSTHEELRRLLETITLQPKAKPQNLPFGSIGTLFKGREEFLDQLRQVLIRKPTHIAAVTGKHAIHGLGGIGKTRAAVEYAWRHKHEYSALLFIAADTPSSLEQNLAGLCGAMVLNLPEQNAREQSVQVAAAMRWLSEHARWFLIVDNVDSIEAQSAVERLLGQLSTGHVVITSRLSSDWPSGVEPLALDVLSEDAAVEFLLERTQNTRRKTPSDDADAHALAKDLDGLALALEQAGAYIREHRLRIADYRDRWREQEAKVLEWFDEHKMKYPRSVAVTWQTSIERMGDDGKRLLNVLCWLAPDPIPRGLIEKLTTVEGEPSIDVEKGLAALAAYSLARWSADAESVTIHKLVEEITRYRLLSTDRQSWLKRALVTIYKLVEKITRYRLLSTDRQSWLNRTLRMVDDFAVGDSGDVRTWATVYTPGRPHLRSVITHADLEKIAEPTTRLMNCLGLYLSARAEFSEAERVLRRALAIDETSYGKDHRNVATQLGNLAMLLADTNRLDEAEPLMRRALAIDEACFGKNHPNVATQLGNLATMLYQTNRLAEAEPLMRRALAIDEVSLGKEHPKITTSLSNLALLLKDTNCLDEAEPLMRRALAIDEACSGENHPKVATELSNLALLLHATNRLTEAEPLMRRALAIDESCFGKNHPNVATRLNNIAGLLYATDRLTEAEPLMRRALAIDEACFGKNHPKIAIELNNLAQLLEKTNRLAEAEPLMRRALHISEVSLGKSHPSVARALNNLATLLQGTNRQAKAEPLIRRAVSILAKSLGLEHPDTFGVTKNFLILLREMQLPEDEIQRRVRAALEES
jgi:tetratricopeptide (TPR) repeat protein